MRKTRPKANFQPPTEPPEQDEPIQLPNSIQTFLKAAQKAGNDLKVILYRRELKPAAGRPKRSFLEEYDNEAPSLKDIATIYGGGSYELQIISEGTEEEEPRLFKSVQFNIDDSYEGQKKPIALSAANTFDPQAQFASSMAMITGFMQAIAPILAHRPQEPQAAAINPAAMFASMSEIGSSLLNNSFKSQMENQKLLMETIRENQSPTISGDQEESGTFDRIIKTLEIFLPIFLNSPAMMKNQLVQQAQQTPEVKSIISSKAKTAELKKKLVIKFGDEKAKKIFEIFDKRQGGNGKVTPKQAKQPEAQAA